MKLKTGFMAGLLTFGLLAMGTDGVLAGPRVGGYFSAGNPGELRYGSGYRMAQTPANQAWERNNAWATYNSQRRQIPTAKGHRNQ
jgi:hypothetical protein